MRIITNGTRDYYDSAGWMDTGVIFNRRSPDEQPQEVFELPFNFPQTLEFRDGRGEDKDVFKFHVLGIGGEAIPVCRHDVYRRKGQRLVISTDYVYDPDELDEKVDKIGKTRTYWLHRSDYRPFMRIDRNALLEWSVNNKAITFILEKQPRKWGDPENRARGVLNVSGLDAFELYRVLDPATAHMRIEGFVSGVLTSNPKIVEISDKSKAHKAGFHEMSFKTRPGTKKPRSSREEPDSPGF